MEALIFAIIVFILFFGKSTYKMFKKFKNKHRIEYIENYKFMTELVDRVYQKHTYLNRDDMHLVERALKDYFIICSIADRKMVAMPSQIVDDLWHEFLLFTNLYQSFCKNAFGRFLHHVPDEVMPSKDRSSEPIKRAWRIACYLENIDPQNPAKLPRIFAIDAQLDVPDGFKYQLNCKTAMGSSGSSACGGFCGSDISCTSGCSGSSGDTSSCSSGGCGGSSCGGGCGGGGD